MSPNSEYAASKSPGRTYDEEQELCRRVDAEFREMPALKLTLPQASRLFGIEPGRCERVLGSLVYAGHLASNGKAFARPGILGTEDPWFSSTWLASARLLAPPEPRVRHIDSEEPKTAARECGVRLGGRTR